MQSWLVYSLLVLVTYSMDLGATTKEGLRHKLASLGQTCQTQSQTLQSLEEEIDQLDTIRLQKTEELTKKQKNITELLSLLSRLERNGPGFVFSGTNPPEEIIRSMIVLQALLRNISHKNFSLKQEVKELNSIHTEMDAKKQALTKSLETYRGHYQEVEDLLKKRRTAVDKELVQRKTIETKTTTIADGAKSLEDLIKRLELEPLATSDKDFTKEISGSTLLKCRPIVGKILAQFGQMHTESPSGKGLVLATTSKSHVVSPFDAQVVYAGPFRTYKNILILAHGTKHHALLIGMDRVDVSVGQTVLAGEPVGRMADTPQPKLYLEVRHKGKPINPLS